MEDECVILVLFTLKLHTGFRLLLNLVT